MEQNERQDNLYLMVKLGSSNRFVVPKEFIERLGWLRGQELLLKLDPDEKTLAIKTMADAVQM